MLDPLGHPPKYIRSCEVTQCLKGSLLLCSTEDFYGENIQLKNPIVILLRRVPPYLVLNFTFLFNIPSFLMSPNLVSTTKI